MCNVMNFIKLDKRQPILRAKENIVSCRIFYNSVETIKQKCNIVGESFRLIIVW